MNKTKLIAAAVVASMSLAAFSGCSALLPLGGNTEVKETCDSYLTKLLKGKKTAKYVDADDVAEPELTDDQWDALLAVTSVAEYKISEYEGSKKQGQGEAVIEFKYVDAEDIASDLDDADIDELVKEITNAKNSEKDKIKLDLVYVDDEWLVTAESDKEAKAFLTSLVDDIKLGNEPAETTTTETSETTEETTEATTEATTETTTEETTTEATSETTSAEETTAETSAPADNGAKYVNFDEMNFYINGKKYTLGQVTLQQLIDDGVPFEESDLENATSNLNKNSMSGGFRINLGKYWSAQVSVLNDTDGSKPANECMVSEVYLPNKPEETQNVLAFDFPLTITADQLKANAGTPSDENNYDDDDYHSVTVKYSTKSKRYIRGSNYNFEFVNGALRYVTLEYIP